MTDDTADQGVSPTHEVPGVSNAMPGERDQDASVAGAAPDGSALDDAASAEEPATERAAGGSGGDSVAGDDVLGATGPDSDSSASKDPSDWVTGDEPMTGAQRSYLDTLAREAGEEISADLTKAEASEHIDRLQKATGRGQ